MTPTDASGSEETRPDGRHPRCPERIGHYHILGKLGEGGFGEVYAAEQHEPVRRRVALKILKAGMDTKTVLARFEVERQVLALMDHPTIAKVFDAGLTDAGRPYFVMEYVPGISITHYCDRHRLDIEKRLLLFASVCDGVHHAHQKGIIHRDVKASNVLVVIQDGQPSPKLIDFGVAKAINRQITERTVFTELGQLIGTPEYMSPEQAELTGLNVDTTTDIYSLGVLLYKLVVGVFPFDSEVFRALGWEGMLRLIREVDPPKPSSRVTLHDDGGWALARLRATEPAALERRVRGELDWIAMKALEKDRTRRYASASEFAADIRRFLRDEPVVACPPSRLYFLRKLVRRHRASFALVTSLGVLATCSTVALSIMYRRQHAALVEADIERGKASATSEFLQSLLASADPHHVPGRTPTVAGVLESARQRVDQIQEPDVQAAVHRTIGRSYMGLGQYDRAEFHLSTAVAMLEIAHGTRDPEALRAKRDLADLEMAKGQYAAAEQAYEDCAETASELWGEMHDEVAESRAGLGAALAKEGDCDRGREALETAAVIMRALHGDHDSRVARLYGLLAWCSLECEDLDSADALFREAIDIAQMSAQSELMVWDLTVGLAKVLQQKDNPVGAVRLLQEAVKGKRLALGRSHPEVVPILEALSQCLAEAGQPDEAETALREAIEIAEATYGGADAGVLREEEALAVLLNAAGRFEAAEPILERALGALEEGPADAARRGHLLRVLGETRYRAGDLRRSEESLEEAAAILGNAAEAEVGDTVLVRGILGLIHRDQGLVRQSQQEIQEAFAIVEDSLGDELLELSRRRDALATKLQTRELADEVFAIEYREPSTADERRENFTKTWKVLNGVLRKDEVRYWETSRGRILDELKWLQEVRQREPFETIRHLRTLLGEPVPEG